jgi:cytochrome P450
VTPRDLFDPRTYEHGPPHEEFARLRREEPVSWHEERAVLGWPEGPGFWAVVRHADVEHVSKTPAVYSANVGATQLRDPEPEDLPFVRQMMLNMDPPEQTRLRRIVNKAFTPRNVEQLRSTVAERAHAIVDRVAGWGECDFAEDLGKDLPLLTLAEVLGVPEGDRHLLYDWSNRIIGYQDDEYATQQEEGARPINPRSRAALQDMFTYAHGLAQTKRAHPTPDIISTLLHAEVDGERITDEEFENFFFLFSVAGNDTLHSAIPGGMLLLLEHPDQHARLRDNLDLMPTAVEEMLRMHSPVIHFRRTATRDVELCGRQIRAGDKVVVFYVSANRDETVFPAAETFDIARTPNDHLAFGAGPHFCLGSQLARLQMRTMFTELLTRLSDMQLAGPVERLRSNFIQGIKHMPVRYTPS